MEVHVTYADSTETLRLNQEKPGHPMKEAKVILKKWIASTNQGDDDPEDWSLVGLVEWDSYRRAVFEPYRGEVVVFVWGK